MSEDELNEWCKEKAAGIVAVPNHKVQQEYKKIADHVSGNGYENVRKFLDGADGWLIAHAKVEGGIVVSQEIRDRSGKAAKIPDIALFFGVDNVQRKQFLLDNGIRFVLG